MVTSETMTPFSIQTAGYEQRKWEEEHLQQATLKFGAKDARSKKKEKEYEYILDDEIEFVAALSMPGTKVLLSKGRFISPICYLNF